MGQDQQTYRRAASASLIGLGVQVVLTVGAALLGLWSQSPAVQAAAWHIAGGLPVWIVLWLLFNQHRIERMEALEAEQLARRDQQAAALFAEHADDLDLARRRLERLNKWGLNIVSLVVSVYLITAGGIWFYRGYRLESGARVGAAINAAATQNALVLMFLLAAITFIAFIIARYVSGMTRVREWQQLRGGAGYLMSTMFLSLLLALGALGVALDYRGAMAWLWLVVPAIMVLIGVEILLTFLLSAYRPRRPGEIARPAFDSRVMGLLTAPESLGSIISETINYQFGFEITSSWFYRLLSKAVTPLLILGALVLIGISSIVVVAPHEEVVITRGGVLQRVVQSGIYLKWPWPLGRADRYITGRIHQMNVGSLRRQEGNVAVLWTNQHAQDGEEKYLVTGPTPMVGSLRAGDNEDEAASQVGALIAAEVVLHYTIANLEQYVTGAQNPQEMIKALAERRVSAFFSSTTIDNLLGGDRVVAGEKLRTLIQQDADAAKLGLKVVFVGLTSVHPPQKSEVAASFHKEVGALQEKEGMIEDARKEATRLLASVAGSADRALEINKAVFDLEQLKMKLEQAKDDAARAEMAKQVVQAEAQVENLMEDARGEAAKQIYEARAYRWSRAVTERAKSERFEAELAAYKAAPRYYAMRQYLDALVEGMADTRKTVLTVPAQTAPVFRMDFKEASSAIDQILEGNN
jgi:regulator of protease activity HflC (stomatin/prohibitin superfamily)